MNGHVTALHEWLRIGVDVLATLLVYRCVVSPAVRWSACHLGAGQYPGKALHGTYPTGPVAAGDACVVTLLVAPVIIACAAVGLAPPESVGLLPAAALGIVLWKTLTLDYDAAQSLTWQRLDRVTAVSVGVAAIAYPPLWLAAIVAACGRLGGWTHHSKACLRLVKAAFAWSVAAGALSRIAGVPPVSDRAAELFVILGTVYLSHYVFAFFSKVSLGAKPWSWVTENRTELLVASAYAWGWARFVPEQQIARLLRFLGSRASWLNAGTLGLEALGMVAFSDHRVFVAAAVGAAMFNVVVAVTSGLFFLENILIGAVFVAVSVSLPEPVRATAFGVAPWLVSLTLLALVQAGLAWRPTDLGWWDTSFSARVYWTARLRDGREVGIYNNVMSPFEREFGRLVGNPLTTEPFVTYPLGGVENAALRDHLLRLDLTEEGLRVLKTEWGRSHWCPDFKAAHVKYLHDLFSRLNDHVSKSPLPRALRWLKAPGGHLYYWGDLPGYRETMGPVEAIQVRYREVYYRPTTNEWIRLRDECLFEVDVDGA